MRGARSASSPSSPCAPPRSTTSSPRRRRSALSSAASGAVTSLRRPPSSAGSPPLDDDLCSLTSSDLWAQAWWTSWYDRQTSPRPWRPRMGHLPLKWASRHDFGKDSPDFSIVENSTFSSYFSPSLNRCQIQHYLTSERGQTHLDWSLGFTDHVGSGNPDHRFPGPAQFDKLTRDARNVVLFT